MALLVQKYGGSSLATPVHIRRAARRIRAVREAGHQVVVVVSAMGRMTDHLLNLARRTVASPPQRELDMLLTAGERVSMALMAMALEEDGVPAISFTGSQTGIVTSGDHTEARIVAVRPVRAREELARGKVVIVAGFQGVSDKKEVTTLGRGGSDTTAVALAAALGAERCEIFTDVDGLFTADPRLEPRARLLPFVPYDEALELASLGAKMHARSIEVAKRYGVTVRIASSFREEGSGTTVAATAPPGVFMEETQIRGIASKDGYHLFATHAPLGVVVPAATARRVTLRFFSCGPEGTHFLVERDKANNVRSELEARRIPFSEIEKVALVSAVGDGLSAAPEVLPRFLTALTTAGVQPHFVCANALSVSAAIPAEGLAAVVQAAHEALVAPSEGASLLPPPNPTFVPEIRS